ncbi:MAG: hypothetical protein ABWX82_01680 [Leifsonia sp.]
MTWSDDAARYLLDSTVCPRCGSAVEATESCPSCAADLTSPAALAAWDWSQKAADALARRQESIAAIPTATAAPGPVQSAAAPVLAPAAASGAPAASGTTTVSAPVRSAALPSASAEISLQSVLAVAGAGLVAVAAIVFTFLNPDIDVAARTTIIGVTTAAFFGGAWLLSRRGLTFSAEAIGGLGMVFLALDIWAFSELAPRETGGWFFAAVGLAVASAGMIAVARIVRLRTWLWAGVVGASLVPAFLGYGFDGPAFSVAGHIGVGFAALLLHGLLLRLQPRFRSPLRADHTALVVLQLTAVAVVLVQAPFVSFTAAAPSSWPQPLGIAVAYAALAILAFCSSRAGIAAFWSATAGILAASALAIATMTDGRIPDAWSFALVPLASSAVLIMAAGLPLPRWIRRGAARNAAMATTIVFALPALAVAAGAVVDAVVNGPTRSAIADVLVLPAAVGGLIAAAAGIWVVSRLSGASEPIVAVRSAVLARWLALPAALAAPAWSALAPGVQVGIGIGLAAVASAILVLAPRVTRSSWQLRAPGIVGAHAVLVFAVVLSWSDQAIAVVAGAAAVLVLVGVAQTVPASVRPAHMGVGFAYALVVNAAALDLAGVDSLPVLCLTTTFASLAALAATLTDWLRPMTWYAVLAVTTVPFLLGIVSVFIERSGWTAVSTGVTFLLALALVLTRRPGLTPVLRTLAGALLVPTLAVVVVCLAAQLLDSSGSPVALPVIAVIVAATLPSTFVIGDALVRHGMPTGEARSVRIAIEISALVTGAVAVLLALVGVAGTETAFIVLVIIGIGAAATGIWLRRYGWWVAAAAWTGALWCRWAIAGIDVIEPYVLPPAIVAVVVGSILITRGRNGLPIAATGLACAVLPSLATLAATGSGQDATAPWRAIGLLCASVLLLVLVWIITRSRNGVPSRLAPLGVPAAVVAAAAAAGGVIQGIRYGTGADVLPLVDPQLVMLPVLGYAVAATVLAAVAGRLAVRAGVRTRWVYAPAVVYLVAGPISAVGPTPLAIWTLWTLAQLLLALVVLTAVRARRHAVTLPPVWFVWAVAWCTAVAGWSEREILRVEGFSLPLGIALLAAGIAALVPVDGAVTPREAPLPSLNAWPTGFRGSWWLLAPGLVAILLPSMLATATDPTTWRAILVIAIALASILIGAVRKLAAPFIIGLVVLPIENIIVFAVQIGRDIQSLPWWITLATAGAVLLVIAVTTERRTGADRGVAARLRDLT